jgi:hypothetical protein
MNFGQDAILLTFRPTNHGSVPRVADVSVTVNLFLDNLDELICSEIKAECDLVASTLDYAFIFLLQNPRS